MSDNKRKGRYYYHRKPKNKDGEAKQGVTAQEKKNTEPHQIFDSTVKLDSAVDAKPTEQNLATAIAISWNKYAWFEEKECALEENSDEWRECCENTDAWSGEYFKMMEKMKSALGYDSDSTFALPELTAVMEKNGFTEKNGLWEKAEKSDK